MRKQIFLLLALVFLLNLFWEISHSFLYISNMETLTYNLILLRASLGDLIFISVIFALVSLKNKNLNWIKKPSKQDYSTIVLLGLVIAIIIEINAISIGKWSYSNSMPTIFGVGITPLIQLAATSLIALWLTKQRS